MAADPGPPLPIRLWRPVTDCAVTLQPATTPVSPGDVAPIANSPHCVSGPATTTGTPCDNPSCSAMPFFRPPNLSPGMAIGGKQSVRRPRVSSSGVASVPAEMSSRPASDASVPCSASSPVSR